MPTVEAPQSKPTAVGQELADTPGLTTLTVGSGVGDFPWTMAFLLIRGSYAACYAADVKPSLNPGYPSFGSVPGAD